MVHDFLLERDGSKCSQCGKPETAELRLTVHHVDHNTHNNKPSNLKLLCPSCNVSEGLLYRRSEKYPTEREREKKKIPIDVGGEASAELTIAPTLWTSWNAFMKTRILRDGYVLLQDAIYEAARVLKEQWNFGSSVTTRRYLKEATSPGGDFVKVWNQNLGHIVKFSPRIEKRLQLA